MRVQLLFICLLFISFKGAAVPPFNDAPGFGPELIYNLPLSEIGIGARAHFHLDNHWLVSPQLNYFIPIGQIHEINLNLHASYIIKPWSKYTPYITAGPYFNYWINHKESAYIKAKALNLGAEIGAGILKNQGCIRPFAEWRFNAKWIESNVRIGFTYYPRVCKGIRKCSTYS